MQQMQHFSEAKKFIDCSTFTTTTCSTEAKHKYLYVHATFYHELHCEDEPFVAHIIKLHVTLRYYTYRTKRR